MDRNLRHSYAATATSARGPMSLAGSGGGGGGGGGVSKPVAVPAAAPPMHPAHLAHPAHTHSPSSQHSDLINYIYDSWNKVTREVERGGEEARYYSETGAGAGSGARLANFRPFNLEEWWGRRVMLKRQHHHHRS